MKKNRVILGILIIAVIAFCLWLFKEPLTEKLEKYFNFTEMWKQSDIQWPVVVFTSVVVAIVLYFTATTITEHKKSFLILFSIIGIGLISAETLFRVWGEPRPLEQLPSTINTVDTGSVKQKVFPFVISGIRMQDLDTVELKNMIDSGMRVLLTSKTFFEDSIKTVAQKKLAKQFWTDIAQQKTLLRRQAEQVLNANDRVVYGKLTKAGYVVRYREAPPPPKTTWVWTSKD